MSIHGERAYTFNQSFPDSQPAFDVWQTSTPPPSTWRHTAGAPPNVIANPHFSAQQHTPYLFDLTVAWDGEGPGVGVPTIVSLGDSTISGEGGRWAGNTNESSTRVDAGATWYWDTPSGESITDCHRSKSALVHIGEKVQNSQHRLLSRHDLSYDWNYPQGRRFKPGVDLVRGAHIRARLRGGAAWGS